MKSENFLDVRTFSSLLGPIRFALEGDELVTLKFYNGAKRPEGVTPSAPTPAAKRIEQALRAYFDGYLGALDSIPAVTSGTPFQERVWEALRRLRPGELSSYSELAAEVGVPGAARAVGTALGNNPVAIVVPCHRVIRNDGTIGGYGGGLERKRWLLKHEGVTLR